MSDRMDGGCACGRIRFSARIETGSVSIAFKNLKKAGVTWAHEPDWYESSPIARRPFCRECGTSLGFQYPDSDNIDLTVAGFDDPTRFVPKFHFGVETMHRAWLNTEGLTEYRIADNPRTVERWMKATGKLPD
jgi:hypothetical protein